MLIVMILTHREMTITPLEELRCSTISELKALKNRLGWHDRNIILYDSGYFTPFHLDPIKIVFDEEEVIMMFGNPMHRGPAYDHEIESNEPGNMCRPAQ
jgi:hypothetical protein